RRLGDLRSWHPGDDLVTESKVQLERLPAALRQILLDEQCIGEAAGSDALHISAQTHRRKLYEQVVRRGTANVADLMEHSRVVPPYARELLEQRGIGRTHDRKIGWNTARVEGEHDSAGVHRFQA